MIAFLTSRLGIAAVAAVAALVVWLYVSGLRSDVARLELERAAAEAKAASLERDLAAGHAAETAANEIIRDLSARSHALDDKVRAYEKELETRPDGRCALSDRDVEWLRDIGD